MRLLDRYLLREFLTPFGYCLLGILVFWISADLFSELHEFQNNHLNWLDVVEYYIVKLPDMLVFPLLPTVLLLALLYTLTNHARYNELTAMRAAGISLWRIASPYFGAGLLLSLASAVMNEFWVPQSAPAAEQILTRHISHATQSGSRFWEGPVAFENVRARREWGMGAYNVVTHEMIGPLVTWKLPDGSRREVHAERAERVNDVWVFTNVQVLVFPPERGATPSATGETNLLALPELTETPEEIQVEIKVNNLMGFRQVKTAHLSPREILAFKSLHPEESHKSAILETDFHEHYAAPWTCLIVVLVALPFGAASGRRNVYVGVASSLVICFAFFVSSKVAVALGSNGALPAWLAAWSPKLLFGLVGAVLTWRVR